MNLTLHTQWEHSHYNPNEGQTHLVITVRASEGTSQQRAPIDLAFALDRSGSMHGKNKIELVKEAVISAVHQLQETDHAALVVFDTDVQTLHDLRPLDASHRHRLERVTRSIQAGSMTNLSGGWLEASQQLRSDKTDKQRIRRVLLLTDGLANVGTTDPIQLGSTASEMRQGGITTSAIGVGHGFDEMLLSGMAEAGGGNFQYIAHAAELEAFLSEEIRSLGTLVAVNPFLDISLPEGMRAELINAFPHEGHRNRTAVDLRDLSAGEEIHLVFAITSRRVGGETIIPEIHLHWTVPASDDIEEINDHAAAIAVRDGEPTCNDTAAEIVALELAARDHREAIKLDREGRYRESRDRFRQSRDTLMQAPDSALIRESRAFSESMAAFAEAPIDEHTRKHTVHAAHMRSRGRRNNNR